MPTIVCAHEPGVGFAADAYARFKGLGVALVTYGPGALNTLNPVACAYAEQSPLLVVSGGPEVALRRPELAPPSRRQDVREPVADLSRGDGRRGDSRRSDRRARDDRPGSAPGGESRNGRDTWRSLATACVRRLTAPAGRLELEAGPMTHRYQAGALDEAVAEIGAMLAGAARAVLYVGVGVRRHGLTEPGRPAGRAASASRGHRSCWASPRSPRAIRSSPAFTWALGRPVRQRARRWLGLRPGDRRGAHRSRHRLLDPANRPDGTRDDRPDCRSKSDTTVTTACPWPTLSLHLPSAFRPAFDRPRCFPRDAASSSRHDELSKRGDGPRRRAGPSVRA